MATQAEGYLKSVGSCEIFYQLWSVENPHATMVVTHGLGEHSDRYSHFSPHFNGMKWNLIAWDLRGHGKSEGKRGYVDNFQSFVGDLDHLLRHLLEQGTLVGPVTLFGHSMGGLITLKYLLEYGDEKFSAIVLSSPALGLGVEVSRLKVKAAELAAQFLPTLTMWNEIRYDDLVRDKDLISEYERDPLRHDKISPGVFFGMLEGFEFVSQNANRIQAPLLLQLAGKERIVSSEASLKVFEKFGSKKKRFFLYDESYHEIYNDLDQEQVFKDLKEFLSGVQLKKMS